jgi:hypothetical protein
VDRRPLEPSWRPDSQRPGRLERTYRTDILASTVRTSSLPPRPQAVQILSVQLLIAAHARRGRARMRTASGAAHRAITRPARWEANSTGAEMLARGNGLGVKGLGAFRRSAMTDEIGAAHSALPNSMLPVMVAAVGRIVQSERRVASDARHLRRPSLGPNHGS